MKIHLIVLLSVFGLKGPSGAQELSLFRLPKAERTIMLVKTDSGGSPAALPGRPSLNVDVVLVRHLTISNSTQTVEIRLIDTVMCSTGARNQSTDEVNGHAVVSADLINLSFPRSAKIAIDGQLVPVHKLKEYISTHWLMDTSKPSSASAPTGIQEATK